MALEKIKLHSLSLTSHVGAILRVERLRSPAIPDQNIKGTCYIRREDTDHTLGFISTPTVNRFRLVTIDMKADTAFIETEPDGLSVSITDFLGVSPMNGNVFNAVVVMTKTVAVAEGVTTGVQVSEIVYKEGPFVALSAEAAKAKIMAAAIVAEDSKVDIDDPKVTYEVKLTAFA